MDAIEDLFEHLTVIITVLVLSQVVVAVATVAAVEWVQRRKRGDSIHRVDAAVVG
jgi:hypothetical protein